MARGRRRTDKNRTSGVATSSNTQQKPPAEPIDESLYEHTGAVFAAYVLQRLAQYASTKVRLEYGPAVLRVSSDVRDDEALRVAEAALIKWLGVGTSEEQAAKKAACERILVEELERKEYFYCAFCDTVLFNHKQALIHFTRPHHHTAVQATYDKAMEEFVRQGTSFEIMKLGPDSVLDAAGALHERLAEEDERIENGRHVKFGGGVNREQPHGLLPDEQFMRKLKHKYRIQLTPTGPSNVPPMLKGDAQTADRVLNMQGDLGRNIMADLDEHLGEKKTWCPFCGLRTGDREGLYAHYTSYAHLKKLEDLWNMCKDRPDGRVPIRCEIQTMAVNVQRRDLIKDDRATITIDDNIIYSV